MTFQNFFMILSDNEQYDSFKNILTNINKYDNEDYKENDRYELKIIYSLLFFLITLFNLIGLTLNFFGFNNFNLMDYIGLSCWAICFGILTSIPFVYHFKKLKFFYPEKLRKIQNKIDNQKILLANLLKDKKFQKEIIDIISILEKSSYVTNENKNDMKSLKLDLVLELQNNHMENAAKIIDKYSLYLTELLEIQETNKIDIEKEKKMIDYINELNNIHENEIPVQSVVINGLDYRKIV